MSNPLESIRQLCEGINNTKFEQAGIFTNAMISGYEMPVFLRDCVHKEKGLYRVTEASGVSSLMVLRESTASQNLSDESAFVYLKPERVDGGSIFTDNQADINDKRAVQTPLLIPSADDLRPPNSSDPFSSPTRRKIASHTKLIPQDIIESEDVSTICATIESIVDQQPGMKGALDLKSKASAARKEYNELINEVKSLENDIEETESYFDSHYGDVFNLLPSKISSPSKAKTIQDFIREEERILLELEDKLKDL